MRVALVWPDSWSVPGSVRRVALSPAAARSAWPRVAEQVVGVYDRLLA